MIIESEYTGSGKVYEDMTHDYEGSFKVFVDELVEEYEDKTWWVAANIADDDELRPTQLRQEEEMPVEQKMKEIKKWLKRGGGGEWAKIEIVDS